VVRAVGSSTSANSVNSTLTESRFCGGVVSPGATVSVAAGWAGADGGASVVVDELSSPVFTVHAMAMLATMARTHSGPATIERRGVAR